jgi:hypothetical protein
VVPLTSGPDRSGDHGFSDRFRLLLVFFVNESVEFCERTIRFWSRQTNRSKNDMGTTIISGTTVATLALLLAGGTMWFKRRFHGLVPPPHLSGHPLLFEPSLISPVWRNIQHLNGNYFCVLHEGFACPPVSDCIVARIPRRVELSTPQRGLGPSVLLVHMRVCHIF